MEIVSRRFILRDFTASDAPAFVAYHADPRSLAFYGPEEAGPGSAGGLLATFAAWAAERPRRNYQLAVVRRAEPHVLVGCAGLRCAGLDAGVAELGMELAPSFWGRYGHALEIGKTLLEFGFGELGLREIVGGTVSANERIARLAEWFGAGVKAERPGAPWLAGRGWHEVVWSVTPETWKRRPAP